MNALCHRNTQSAEAALSTSSVTPPLNPSLLLRTNVGRCLQTWEELQLLAVKLTVAL